MTGVRESAAEEIVYSSESQLRSPAQFVADLRSDLRVAPAIAWRLFLHNLRAGYRQSLLGYFWLLIPPAVTAGTWVLLNSARVLDVGETELPYALYVLVGTLLWQVFAEALNSPLQQLTSARGILTKSRTPHEALLLAGAAEVLFNFAVRAAVLLPVFIWLNPAWGWPVLLAPVGVGALFVLGFSIGLLLAPAGLLYRDVIRGLSLVTGFWFFLTPVIYQPPENWPVSLLVTLNPVAPLLITARRWLAGAQAWPAPGFAWVVALSLICFAFGWLCHRLARPHLVARF